TTEVGGQRPAAFDAAGDKIARVTLARAHAGFAEFPKEVTVKGTGPDGQPAAGVTVAASMNLREDREKKGAKREWEDYKPVQTGVDGTAKVKYEDLRFNPVLVRDPENRRMAIEPVSPVSLLKGEVNVTLKPECRVTGTIVCEERTKAGNPVGWTNVYV